jgi:DNA-binding transcriptional LysR family regulator
MELRHLKYFVIVAEEENVTRAAARLHVSQPGLSRQIRDLEEELGVPLFYHRAKSLKLTEAGHLFLEEARAVLQRTEEAMRTVRDFASGPEGVIHVGFAPSLTTRILPSALRRFHDACPRVRVQLHDLTTEEMVAGLGGETLHAALCVRPSGPMPRSMTYHELGSCRPCVAFPSAHPLARKENLELQDLTGESVLAYSSSDYPEYHRWFALLFRKLRRSPSIVAQYDSSAALIAAVESGAGIAIVQEGFECLAGQRLMLRTIEGSAQPFSFGVLWNRKFLTPASQKFVHVVRTQAIPSSSIAEDHKTNESAHPMKVSRSRKRSI